MYKNRQSNRSAIRYEHTKALHIADKSNRVVEWIAYRYSTQIQPIAEIQGHAEIIDEHTTFADICTGGACIVILDTGKEAVIEYYKDIQQHKIVSININRGVYTIKTWQSIEWEWSSAQKMIEDELSIALVQEKTDTVLEWKIVHIDTENDVVYTETDTSCAVVQCVYLGDRTENINTVEKKILIVPVKMYGQQIVKLYNIQKDEVAHKTMIVVTYAGVEGMAVMKLNDKVRVKDSALVVIETVSKKKNTEAVVKYDSKVVGLPFYITIDDDDTAAEIKKSYKVEHTQLVRITRSKQVVIEDSERVKKGSSTDKFVFLADNRKKSRIRE